MRWSAICEALSETVHHYKFRDPDGITLTFEEVIALWCANSIEGKQFRTLTVKTIIESPFGTFRWETPVVDLNRRDREFEFVLLDSPGLDRLENRRPFERQMETAAPDEIVIEFSNLGRDAVLVVPTFRSGKDVASSKSTGSMEQPGGEGTLAADAISGQVNYCHLASFLRSASPEQADQLWHCVGAAMGRRMSDKPVWLNTAGGGVAWLHIRLDDRPKYYSYLPFKKN